MKEEHKDPIEKLFREGLRDFHDEPDDKVWAGVVHGYKAKRWVFRFKLFSIITLLALVAGGVIYYTQYNNEPSSVMENPRPSADKSGITENRPPESGNQSSSAPNAGTSSTQNPEAQNSPNNSGINNSYQTDGESPVSNNTPSKDDPVNHPPSKWKDNPFGMPPGSGRGEGQGFPGLSSSGKNGDRDEQGNQNPSPGGSMPTEKYPAMTVHGVAGKDFTFSYFLPEAPTWAMAVSSPSPSGPGKPEKKDSMPNFEKGWFVSGTAGLISPAVYLSSPRSNPEFAKKNTGIQLGFSGGLSLSYKPKTWYGISAGLDIHQYETRNTMATWGATDSVEYITESRQTGYYQRFDSVSVAFNQSYSWISLPLDFTFYLPLDRNTRGHVFAELSAGLGVNFLSGYTAHPGLKKYISPSDLEGDMGRFRLSARFGAGLGYNTGKWSYFATFQYNALTQPLYKPSYFTEKHHLQTLRLGVRYFIR